MICDVSGTLLVREWESNMALPYTITMSVTGALALRYLT